MATLKAPVKTPKVIRRPTIAGGPWLTVEEAAEKVGLSKQTLHQYRWAKVDGRPLGRKLGNRVLYSESEVERYAKSREDKA